MKKLVLASAVVLALSACSVRNGGALEHWNNYGDTTLSANGLADNQALVVFYREADVQGQAINVYINGDYQASLLDKSYTPMAVCASKQLFSTSYSANNSWGNRTEGSRFTLPVHEVAYVRVTNGNDGKPVLSKVSKEEGEKAVANLKLVTNTLSRVVTHKACEPVLAAIDLSAGALFPLNKSGYNDILPNGRQQIADFAAHINTIDQSRIKHITVSGYTDPEAGVAYNQKLSERRAATVSRALKEAGVTAKIEAVGYGKADLLVPNCASLHPKDKKARAVCNQPNRRVEIAVLGNN